MRRIVTGRVRPAVERVAVNVFVSYAHEDGKYRDEMMRHLALLRGRGVASSSDADVAPGARWHDEIQRALRAADTVILLVSAAFLGSSYISDFEAPVIFARPNGRHPGKEIIPVFTRPTSVARVPYRFRDAGGGPGRIFLTALQGINTPDRPLSALSQNKRETVYVELALRLVGDR